MPCIMVAVLVSQTRTGTGAPSAASSAELAVPESAVEMWMERICLAPAAATFSKAVAKALGEGWELCGSSSAAAILS